MCAQSVICEIYWYTFYSLDTVEYQILMTFLFAIDEINKDPHLLPNITLGYHLFNTCGYNMKAIDSIMKILTGYKGRAPNYSCMEIRKVIGFVGDTNFPSTLAMAELLNIYQYPQVDCFFLKKMSRASFT